MINFVLKRSDLLLAPRNPPTGGEVGPLTSVLSLFLIFCLALFLRLYNLGSMPVRLHQDEIMNGYVGRFILENGVDPRGNRWPLLYFNNFGDYPNVIPMYISGLFTYLFGINELAIRFPIAVAGALAVIAIYLLGKLVFEDELISLFGALTLAILPWHIVLSRATAEHILGSTVFLYALTGLLYAIKTTKLQWLVASLPLFLSTYLLYPSFRIIIPLMFFGTLLIPKTKSFRVWLLGFCVLTFALTGLIGKTDWGRARFQQTAVFYFNNTVNDKINSFAAGAGTDNILVVRIFNNKLIVYTREIIRQYLSYFSPNFLFTDGGKPFRYFVPDQGLLYLGFLGLFVAWMLQSVLDPSKSRAKIQMPFFLLILFILALAPLSSALTLDEVPNVHRSGFMGVMLVFVISYCFFRIKGLKLWKIPILPLLLLFTLFEFPYFLNQYFVQGPMAQAHGRYDERTDLTKYLIEHREEYEKILVTREMFPIYYAFYTQNFDKSLAGKFGKNLFIESIDNLYFIDHDCPSMLSNEDLKATPKSLIVDRSHCEWKEPRYTFLKSILNRDGTTAYTLYLATSKSVEVEK